MLSYLHKLSAVFFFLFGSSFFFAYILLKNKVWTNGAAIWMQTADLPFVFSAAVYGGLSLYLSLRSDDSKMLPWMIWTPLTVFFGLVLLMNFWPGS